MLYGWAKHSRRPHIIIKRTMTDNQRQNNNQDEGSMSQESAAIVTQVFTGDDFNDSARPDLGSFLAQHPDMAENSEINDHSENAQDEATMPPQQAATAPTKQKRNGMVFNNKKLRANRELFLLPEFHNQFADESFYMTSKIVKYAAKKDKDSEFVVQWDVDNIPATINMMWLKQRQENTDSHWQILQEAITSYEENVTVTGQSKKRKRCNNASSENSRGRDIDAAATPVGNSITIAATAAAASIRTSSSMVSSLEFYECQCNDPTKFYSWSGRETCYNGGLSMQYKIHS